MVRIYLAAIVAVTLTSFAGVTFGQDDPHAEHAMPGEHGMHEHAEMPMEDESPRPVSENFLMWFLRSLGWKYILLMPLSGLVSFALTAGLVIFGKGKTTGAALVFIVAIPFLIGLFGLFDGMLSSFMVIAHSTVSPKPSVLAEGIGTSIVTPLFGMLLMVPSYLLATAGLSVRAVKSDSKP